MKYSADKMEEFVALLERHSPQEGLNETSIPDLVTFRQTDPHQRCPAVYEPALVILGQGKKHCYLDGRKYDYSAGHYLTLFLPMPIEVEVVEASADKPLLMAGIKIDLIKIANILLKMDRIGQRPAQSGSAGSSVIFAEPLNDELLEPIIKLLRTLEYLGVDVSKVNIVKMDGSPGAAALSKHRVDMACAFGGPLTRMKEVGYVLMSGKEQEEFGLLTFDVVSATKEFAENHADLLTKFMQVTEDANRAYAKDPAHAQPIIAKAAGMKLEDSNAFLEKFSFPSKEEQLSEAWFGGTVQAFCKGAADFFVKQKVLPKALDDYSPYIDDSFLKKVK